MKVRISQCITKLKLEENYHKRLNNKILINKYHFLKSLKSIDQRLREDLLELPLMIQQSILIEIKNGSSKQTL